MVGSDDRRGVIIVGAQHGGLTHTEMENPLVALVA